MDFALFFTDPLFMGCGSAFIIAVAIGLGPLLWVKLRHNDPRDDEESQNDTDRLKWSCIYLLFGALALVFMMAVHATIAWWMPFLATIFGLGTAYFLLHMLCWRLRHQHYGPRRFLPRSSD